MSEYTTPQGKLVVSPAGFEDAMELKRCVLKSLEAGGFKFTSLTGAENLDVVIKAAVGLESDKDVYNALWPCLIRCTLNGEKVTKATFEDTKNRPLYLFAVAKCLEENLKPFIEGLPLVLGIFGSQQ